MSNNLRFIYLAISRSKIFTLVKGANHQEYVSGNTMTEDEPTTKKTNILISIGLALLIIIILLVGLGMIADFKKQPGSTIENPGSLTKSTTITDPLTDNINLEPISNPNGVNPSMDGSPKSLDPNKGTAKNLKPLQGQNKQNNVLTGSSKTDAAKKACKQFVKNVLADPSSAQFDSYKTYRAKYSNAIYDIHVGVRISDELNPPHHVTFDCNVGYSNNNWLAFGIKQID